MARHRRIAAVLGQFALLAAAANARAACLGPQASLRWTYPDPSGGSVPPGAVFWAVSHAGQLEVEIDGVRLSPRGTSFPERYQFVPAMPLVEGRHEFVARVIPDVDAGSDDGTVTERERRLIFQVSAQQPAVADVAISAVTVYPLLFSSDGLIHPPQLEYDTECSKRAVSLEWTCNDIIPKALARVAYEGDGSATLGYLVQGNYLVPPGCASFWTDSDTEPEAARFTAAAVLPTGVGEVHTFAGSIEHRPFAVAHPDRYSQPSACSLTLQRRSPNLLVVAAGLAVAAWFVRRPR